MNCTQAREMMPGFLYGELDERERTEFDRHVAGCAECTAELSDYRRVMTLMKQGERPEPTEAEWKAFDRRLGDAIGFETGAAHDRRTSAFPPAPRPTVRLAWAYGIAAVLLIGFGLFMGKIYFGGDRPEMAGNAGNNGSAGDSDGMAHVEALLDPSDTEAEREALAWLERTRTVLMGVTNLDDRQTGSIDLVRYAKVSNDLYDRGNTVAAALNSPSRQQLRRLIIQLQVILLQLSNVGEESEGPAIEVIRRGVDSKSLLLKINLETIRAAMNSGDGGDEAIDGLPDTAATDGTGPGGKRGSAGPGKSRL